MKNIRSKATRDIDKPLSDAVSLSMILPLIAENRNKDISPEIKALAQILNSQPTEMQEAFEFLLVTAMQDAGKYELLNVAEVGGRWHYTFGRADEVFSLVRPEMDKDAERKVREMMRDMLEEEGLL